jgi:hypothetical protein
VTHLPETLAIIADGRLDLRMTSKQAQEDPVQHTGRYTLAEVDAMALTGPVLCPCHDGDARKILAQRKDGVLIVRKTRHGQRHFVVLTRGTLAALFDAWAESEYSSSWSGVDTHVSGEH